MMVVSEYAAVVNITTPGRVARKLRAGYAMPYLTTPEIQHGLRSGRVMRFLR
jgi:hypothetical protein